MSSPDSAAICFALAVLSLNLGYGQIVQSRYLRKILAELVFLNNRLDKTRKLINHLDEEKQKPDCDTPTTQPPALPVTATPKSTPAHSVTPKP
jgi:hypothetical protein